MKKWHKFNAVRTIIDGISFPSKAEARRYQELKVLEKAGEISLLILQPRFPLSVNGEKICVYISDFSCWDERGKCAVTEDVKGVKTPTYRIKKKLVKALYNITIKEV